MKRIGILWLILPLFLSAFSANANEVRIVDENGYSRVSINGSPVYIKGIGGGNHLEIASANGANAFRTWGGNVESIRKDIEKAQEGGMYIMQGIDLTKDVNAYSDESYKNAKREEVRLLAETFKDSPQIFAWGVGNELELGGANVAEMWKFVDELAQTIKSVDKNHLVANVICITTALDSIAVYAPHLDFVGINSYGYIDKLAEMVEHTSYKGPFMVTEWGPSGYWEMPATLWNAPIEQTSEEKRVVYEERYNKYILANPRCMGSFVFLWGQKEERTPTWFSMFVEKNVDGLPLNGEKTPMVEAMERVWKGEEPAQTAPVISKFTLNGKEASESVTADPDSMLKAKVSAADKEDDGLTYVWEILKEATVLGFGGSYEPRPERVGETVMTREDSYEFSIDSPGNYRIYTYVLDNTGYVATANIPFRIGQKEVYRNDDLTISELKEKTWVIETADKTTMYIIEGDTRAMLIDTGTKCADLDKVVRKITDKPLDVVITHLHPDHAGNIGYFDSIFLHPADTVMMDSYNYTGKINYLSDGQIFDLGGTKIEVAWMPGHTPGSVVLLNRETGDCFTGDAFGSWQVWLHLEPHVPMSVYLQSCRKLVGLMENEGIKYIWCGHYPYIKGYYDLKYIRTIESLASRLVAGDEDGAKPFDMSPSGFSQGDPKYISDGPVMLVYNADKIN